MPPVTLDLLARTSVVIPTLNEAASIGKVIEELPKGLLEVLIVDGNSTDGTQSEAQARGARVVVEPRKGYGRAYKTGFLEARGAFIATLDGDLTYPAERVGELVGRLDEGRLDFITCDRLTTLRREAMSGKHRFGNFVLSLTTRVLFGVPVRDSQSGMWVFRREVLKIFPDKELVELPNDHPIYRCFYRLPGLPKIHEHDALPPQCFAIVDRGRVLMIYTYQSDIGDGLEDPDVHKDPPEKREAAMRMAVNILIYAMTH